MGRQMKKYKIVEIRIVQVENGYDVDFSASFQTDIDKANSGEISRMFVAKTEKEVLAIIQKVLPEIKELPPALTAQDICNSALQMIGHQYNKPLTTKK